MHKQKDGQMMSEYDREFVNSIIDASEEEFNDMVNEMTDEELIILLGLIQTAKAELLEKEMDLIEESLDTNAPDITALLDKFKLK